MPLQADFPYHPQLLVEQLNTLLARRDPALVKLRLEWGYSLGEWVPGMDCWTLKVELWLVERDRWVLGIWTLDHDVDWDQLASIFSHVRYYLSSGDDFGEVNPDHRDYALFDSGQVPVRFYTDHRLADVDYWAHSYVWWFAMHVDHGDRFTLAQLRVNLADYQLARANCK